jgi:hypothetical protein
MPNLTEAFVYSIADTFGIPITYDPVTHRLTGAATADLKLFPGMKWPMEVGVVEGRVYLMDSTAYVIARISGALYAACVVTKSGVECAGDLILFDFTKSAARRAASYPGWSRSDLYKRIAPGVVRWYKFRDLSVAKRDWTEVADPKGAIEQYIEKKQKSVLSQTSDKFRTVGPRGV